MLAAEAYWAAEQSGPQYAGGEEEYEEYEEEEEGEEEYASYKPHSENGKEEAHVEPAVLIQPLQESTSEGEAKAGAAVRLCQDSPHEVSETELCARYASVLGWIKKHVVRPAKRVWNSTVRYVVRGASDTWKTMGVMYSTVKTGLEVGVREYFDDGGPP